MDNREFKITSEGKEDFALSIKIAFGKYNKATGYMVKDNTLVFFWGSSNENAIPLPYPMGSTQATEFAWGWLELNEPTEKEPSHDGDNGKGFTVYCDFWGHVMKNSYAFVGIKPEWAWYGK
jgi:hypothetical protein